MTTRTSVNAAAGRILRDLAIHFPECHAAIIRIAVFRAKEAGTIVARDVLRGMLNEMYRESHGGVEPVGRHDFIHWMRDKPLRDDGDDPIQGVNQSDAFEAAMEVIT